MLVDINGLDRLMIGPGVPKRQPLRILNRAGGTGREVGDKLAPQVFIVIESKYIPSNDLLLPPPYFFYLPSPLKIRICAVVRFLEIGK